MMSSANGFAVYAAILTLGVTFLISSRVAMGQEGNRSEQSGVFRSF
jgi:hypothetical protein